MMLIRLTFIALFFAIPAMATQNKQPGERDKQQAEQNLAQKGPQPVSVAQNDSGTHNENARAQNPNGWHKFIAWPEGITTWAIMLTLGAIAWQAWETRKAARAAATSAEFGMQNTQALIFAERPWLTVHLSKSKVIDGFFVRVRNQGRTPARIKSIDSNPGVLVTRPEDLVIPEGYTCPTVFPDTAFIVKGFTLRRGSFPEELLQERRKGSGGGNSDVCVMVYGRIQYDDIFPFVGHGHRGIHETSWCYVYDPARKIFRTGGPEQYTRNT